MVFAPDIVHWIPPKSLMRVISSGVTYMMCKVPFDGSIATLSLLGNGMFNSFFDADVQVKLTPELGPWGGQSNSNGLPIRTSRVMGNSSLNCPTAAEKINKNYYVTDCGYPLQVCINFL